MKNEVRPIDAEPLTLEQLREMDGQKIGIGDAKGNVAESTIVNAGSGFAIGKSGTHYNFDYCGKTWYAYPPARIDREAWEPCGEMCRNNCATCDHNADELFGDADYCKDCHRYSKWESSIHKYCERCGRPRTPGAWAELENRMGARV